MYIAPHRSHYFALDSCLLYMDAAPQSATYHLYFNATRCTCLKICFVLLALSKCSHIVRTRPKYQLSVVHRWYSRFYTGRVSDVGL